jgi:D-alanyl-D-alanine dipeptidase
MNDGRRKGRRIEWSNFPPVPIFETILNAGRYREVAIDQTSAFHSERLVDLKEYGIAGVSFYHVSDGSNPPYRVQLNGSIPQLLARKTVAEMLARVNLNLATWELELFVWDAYRPLTTQVGIWSFFEHQVRSADPSKSEDAVYSEVIKYVSDPRKFNSEDSRTWPTHLTGASVDLTIRHKQDLHLLDLGAEFDQMDEASHTSFFERQLKNGAIQSDDVRLHNRRLLNHVMTEHGFTNYPLEYWHFDWGNQMHQFVKSVISGDLAAPAFYGII